MASTNDPVDLELADRQVLQHGQTCEPGAEVVDGDADAQSPKVGQQTASATWLGHDAGLGDLELEQDGRDVSAALLDPARSFVGRFWSWRYFARHFGTVLIHAMPMRAKYQALLSEAANDNSVVPITVALV
jgi:hypothetical protein